jgi:hypothetical protein
VGARQACRFLHAKEKLGISPKKKIEFSAALFSPLAGRHTPKTRGWLALRACGK